jgi:hypothetical protein
VGGAAAAARHWQKVQLPQFDLPLDWDWAKGRSVPGLLRKPALPAKKNASSSRKRKTEHVVDQVDLVDQGVRELEYQRGLQEVCLGES